MPWGRSSWVVVSVHQHWPASLAGVRQPTVDCPAVVDEGGACRDAGGEGSGRVFQTITQADIKMRPGEKLGWTVFQVHVHQGDEDCEARLAVVLVEDLVSRVGKTEEKLEVTALDAWQVGLNKW